MKDGSMRLMFLGFRFASRAILSAQAPLELIIISDWIFEFKIHFLLLLSRLLMPELVKI